MAEIAADKDLLRAEFAMSTRSLEMKVEPLSKDTSQLLQLGRNGNTIHHLRTELNTVRDRLHATNERFAAQSGGTFSFRQGVGVATLMRDLAQQSRLSRS